MVFSIFLNMDVSVIIVNYNTCELLDNCLEAIRNHTHDVEYEVIVVDNASTDKSRDMIYEKYPWVSFVESDKNLGFGQANNLGFKYSIGRNIFLLNSDTLLIENSIKILSDTLDNDKTIGAVGGILIGKDGQQVHSYGKFPTFWGKLLGKKFVITDVDFKENTKVDYITGADLMIPRSVWDKTGGFDPEFFLYYEETDLEKRIASLGYHRVLAPSTKIIHLEGESAKIERNSSGKDNWKNIVMFRSMLYYMKKHSRFLTFKLMKLLLRIKYYILSVMCSKRNNYYRQLIEYIQEY